MKRDLSLNLEMVAHIMKLGDTLERHETLKKGKIKKTKIKLNLIIAKRKKSLRFSYFWHQLKR